MPSQSRSRVSSGSSKFSSKPRKRTQSDNKDDSVKKDQVQLFELPNDLQLDIWKRLDVPTNLVKTSRYFQEMGRDPYFQSQWFLYKFGIHKAIFKAICFPGIFRGELLSLLLAGGAVLSRTLVQGLSFARVVSKQRGRRYRGRQIESPGGWGRSISFSSFAAVLSSGASLYPEISTVAGLDDSSIFNNWLNRHWAATGDAEENFEKVQALFVEGAFLPLPIALPNSSHALKEKGTESLLVKALVKDPRLIPFAARNGAVIRSSNAQVLLRKVFSKDSLGVEGIVELARECISSIPGVSLTPGLASQILMSICVKEDSLSYRALKQIRFDPLLSHFDLQDLVKQVILAVRTNEASLSTSLSLSTAVLKKTCKQLAADFSLSDGGEGVRQVNINSLFSALETGSASLAELRELELTEDELFEALIQNGIQSVKALKVIKLQKPIDAAFISRLFTTILDQPYKGKLIQSFSAWFNQEIESRSVALRERSISAVDTDDGKGVQAQVRSKIDESLLPTSLQEELIKQVLKHDFELKDLSSGAASSKHSLLALDWTSDLVNTLKAEGGQSGIVARYGLAPRPLTSRFLDFSNLSSAEDEEEQVQKQVKTVKTERKALDAFGHQDLVPLQTLVKADEDAQVANPRRRRGYPSYNYQAAPRAPLASIPSAKPNSVLGSVSPECISNGRALLNLFGNSKVVSVFLDHSILNSNFQLSKIFIEAGLPSPTLRHFQIFALSGQELPIWMSSQIIKGAPFFKSWGDSSDDIEILASQASLSSEEILASCLPKKKGKVSTSTARTANGDETSLDTSNSLSFNTTGDTTMTSVDESVDEKTDTSVLRRSTREKRARFEPAEVKEESEDSDEQRNENEVAVGKMEEDEKPKDSQDSLVRPGSLGMVNRSFMIMEEGKPVRVSEEDFTARDVSFRKWISHLEGMLRAQEHNLALKKAHTPRGPTGRAIRQNRKGYFHQQLESLLPILRAAHKKLLSEAHSNLDAIYSSNQSRQAVELIQELRSELEDLVKEKKENKHGADEFICDGTRRQAFLATGLSKGYSNGWNVPRAEVDVDSEDETWDISFHARRRILQVPAAPSTSTPLKTQSKKRKQRASSDTSDFDSSRSQSRIKKEVWYCSDSSHSSNESESEEENFRQVDDLCESVESSGEEEDQDGDSESSLSGTEDEEMEDGDEVDQSED